MSNAYAAAESESMDLPTGCRSPVRTISAYDATIEVEHGTSAVKADVYLLTVSEGLSPRALLFPLIRLPLGISSAVVSLYSLFEAFARECVRTFRLPPHWSGDLHDFLARRAIFSAPGARDFLNTAALGHGFCTAAMRRGEYTHTVWDLCSGREVHLDALQPRARVYANAVATPADVTLYTRFVRCIHIENEDTTDALSHLVREITFVLKGGYDLIKVETLGKGFVVEYEASVQRWLMGAGVESSVRSADRCLARALMQSLQLTSSAAAVARRIRALRAELSS